jgi:hypothetical protein
MKKHGYIRLLVCALLIGLAAASAHAQSAMKVNVPFDFTVGDKTLQAGQYSVEQALPQANPNALRIRKIESNGQTLSLGIGMESPANVKPARLVFRKYGNHYFLAQVWLSAGNSGTEIRKGSLERELARGGSMVEETTILAELR